MKDYTNYHNASVNEKIIRDGSFILETTLNGYEGRHVVIDGVSTSALIEDKFSGNNAGFIKRIIARKGDFHLGSIIVEEDQKTWIVTTLPSDGDGLSQESLIQLCNEKLRWYDRDGNLNEIFCSIAHTSSASRQDVDYNRFDLNLLTGYLYIFVPLIPLAREIRVDQRFVFGSSCYQIVGVDDASMVFNDQGVIRLTVKIDTKNPKDDLTNKIADNSHLYGGTTIPPLTPPQSNNGWDD